ncbi:MAG: HNH endonuclease signature motif containing protein, partial [Gemmatimonadota bacterium]
ASPSATPDSLATDSLAHDSRHGLGDVLDVGRRTRTVPPALRRALEVRDRGCRFPGCGLRFADAHHIEHWADGGRTALDNLVLLCRRHHRRVHEDGWSVCCDRDGRVVFFTPKGTALAEVPEPGRETPSPLHPLHRLLRRNRSRSVAPDWRTGIPRSTRDSAIPARIEAAAWEALDP